MKVLAGLLLFVPFQLTLARSVKILPLKDQVCAQSVIVAAEIMEVIPDSFAVQNLKGPRKYTDFYTVARLKVEQVLKGDLDRTTAFEMYFRSRSENSPYDYGDKYYSPAKGSKGIWYVTSREPFFGYFGSGNFLGNPIDIAKKKEIIELATACGK